MISAPRNRFELPERLHFVGIGGIGMSGLAEMALAHGCRVSGSDLRFSARTRRLQSLGAVIARGQHPAHLFLLGAPPNWVVVSSALSTDNTEVVAAHAQGFFLMHRSELLAQFFNGRVGVGVTGTHGKTTVSALLTTVLACAGLDPTAVVGGVMAALGTNVRLGQTPYVVAEADESDGSFLKLAPHFAVVTNIDSDHMSHWGDMAALVRAFRKFMQSARGQVIVCDDDAAALQAAAGLKAITYGLSPRAHYYAQNIEHEGFSSRFVAYRQGEALTPVELPLIGRHNVQNAMAAVALAGELNIPFDRVARALSSFEGVGRRFSLVGKLGQGDHEMLIADDYAHHPAEIRATLSGIKAAFPQRRLVVLFQPHRYSRTSELFDEFATAFSDADVLFVADIYTADESPLDGIDSTALAQRIYEKGHPSVHYICPVTAHNVLRACRPGDIILTMGAGDIYELGPELLAQAQREYRTR